MDELITVLSTNAGPWDEDVSPIRQLIQATVEEDGWVGIGE